MNGAKSLSRGRSSPLPMDTEENHKKLQTAPPPTALFQSSEKQASVYSEQNSSPRFIVENSPLLIPKLDNNSSHNDPISILVQTSDQSAPGPSPRSAPYQVPIILNNFLGSPQSNNILTLLQSPQNVPNHSSTQHILLDVGSNSLPQSQRMNAKSLNGVIPIQLNISPRQPLQPNDQQQQPPPQQQQQQQQPPPPQQQPPPPQQQQQPPPQHQQQQVLNINSTQAQSIILASLSNDSYTAVSNSVSESNNHIQVQHPASVQPRLSDSHNPQLIHTDGTQVTLDSNRRPVLSYPQVSLSHAPKAIFNSNGICQMENLQITGSTWVKESPNDHHAIPFINTTLSPHFSVDPAYDIVQRRRKKRAVFAPQVRRTLEASFEQNTRPSRRELEYLAGKLGLLFEEVRVWFCNKRQKERQQMQQLANDQSQGDACGDSYSLFVDGSPPPVVGALQSDDSFHEQECHVKEELESDNMVLPTGVADSRQLPPDELMPDPIEPDFEKHSLEPNDQNSIP